MDWPTHILWNSVNGTWYIMYAMPQCRSHSECSWKRSNEATLRCVCFLEIKSMWRMLCGITFHHQQFVWNDERLVLWHVLRDDKLSCWNHVCFKFAADKAKAVYLMDFTLWCSWFLRDTDSAPQGVHNFKGQIPWNTGKLMFTFRFSLNRLREWGTLTAD